MLPFLNIFGLEVPMYGVMFISAIIVSILLAILRSKKYNIPKQEILFLSLYAVIGGLIGAKLLYIIVTIPSILEHIHNTNADTLQVVLFLFQGGFVFYGGLIGGFLAALIYMKQYKLPFESIADIATPTLPVAHAIGRIGCFFAGCCYGLPVSWGVEFNASLSAPHDIALMPTQLIESSINIIFALVLYVLGRYEKFRGKLLYFYIIFYSITRFILEFFRYDAERGVFGFLSTSQYISIILLAIAIFFLVKKSKVITERT